jgi:hypothetical protein
MHKHIKKTKPVVKQQGLGEKQCMLSQKRKVFSKVRIGLNESQD